MIPHLPDSIPFDSTPFRTLKETPPPVVSTLFFIPSIHTLTLPRFHTFAFLPRKSTAGSAPACMSMAQRESDGFHDALDNGPGKGDGSNSEEEEEGMKKQKRY